MLMYDPGVKTAAPHATSQPPATSQPSLLRINEAAAAVGLTARSIRYYESIGLVTPAARSDGDYRLYDEQDIERLTFIKGLRDDAGFSLAEVAQLLEDKQARRRNRDQLQVIHDPVGRSAILTESIARLDRQVDILRTKIERLSGMVRATEDRRARLEEQRAELLGAGSPVGAEDAPHP
jgi:MerR family copper efflux transcriptional regulator